ncbi:hypothetical protein G3480_12730 [Thiorhodococcus mannitoliphagus]|uniref:YprB ribonuclease H-like domain-containing protein n=1 Tax=Thiorhodococcus mannitoliphagus TaxID=329406 RepID=A0A6P1DST9_9GAMM|nr:ribonuclease H-like domain-containing protein [Thiorhodococcus mannitoliphagus]NEX21168.1 hypothetical protein [Thiorhodococcus mannitoliphagus]
MAEQLGAEPIAPGVLLIERRLGARLRHGRVLLKPEVAEGARVPPSLIELAWREPSPDSAPSRLLFLDTETSGLAGGTGTWAFLTGILIGAPDTLILRQYLLTSLDAESAYLDAVGGELSAPATLVSYNGRAFDAPLLTTRFRLCGQPDPLGQLWHLDLLAPVRRAFGRVWPDCRLMSAESKLLGFAREDDLPGSAAPAAWLGWIQRGEMAALGGVLRHNRWDLLSLAGLIPVLGEAFEDPGCHGADTHAVARHHWAQGRLGQALSLLEADSSRLTDTGLMDLADLYRRQDRWADCCAIWQRLASQGSQDALSALAKYHEHKRHDLPLALEYAEALAPSAEREHRCQRLRRKLQG